MISALWALPHVPSCSSAIHSCLFALFLASLRLALNSNHKLQMQQNFNEDAFKRRVTAALEKVKTILDNSRQPQFPADVPHQYDDKYLLAEFVASNTISSIMHVLTTLGVNEKHLAQLKEWSKKRSVSLRLRAEENCKFIRKATREVESDTKSVHKSTLFGKSESYTVTKVRSHLALRKNSRQFNGPRVSRYQADAATQCSCRSMSGSGRLTLTTSSSPLWATSPTSRSCCRAARARMR